MKSCVQVLGIFLVTTIFTIAAETPRKHTGFDNDWRFIQRDVPGFEKPDFDDSSWRKLSVPHDWSIEGEYDQKNPMGAQCGYLPAGNGVYRKTIPVPGEWKGKRVSITFDGVFQNSTVWANGKKLGFRPYGWISFSYDLTETVSASDSLTIAVHVDNTKQPSARWYTGSGIYAHTWITVTDKVHVPESGVFVKTKGFQTSSDVSIQTEVRNASNTPVKVLLKTRVVSPNGEVVASADGNASIPAGETMLVSQDLSVQRPEAWSPESPALYAAVSDVMVDDKVVDRVQTRFGIRDIEWKAATGFWLNGRNVKLRGVCNHQDAGPLGAAVPDKILRYRIQQLKDMGCNAIRTAHNPQTPIFYDLCDELGMLVMDEIFDGWGRKAPDDYGAHSFGEWWKRDVTDWIRRDRNHPSVVIYSVGNETKGSVAGPLVAQCRKLDPTRLVTSGDSEPGAMDVIGKNGHSEVPGYFKKEPQKKPLVATENPHTWQVRGYYRSRTWYRDGDKQGHYKIDDLTETEIFVDDWIDPGKRQNRKQIFNSSYDNATVRIPVRAAIALLRDVPYYAGNFRWTGHDYIGEAGYVHGGWPFKAFMGGAIDLANFEKDLYYLYQSQWTSKPMVHILPHWTHPVMKPGTKIPVWAYSNGDAVELFLNGKSLGTQTPGKAWEKMQCEWLVPWTPGELKAVATRGGQVVATSIHRTASEPAHIALSVDGEGLTDRAGDSVQLRIASQDKNGVFYPYGENLTYVHLIGPARLKALGNGSPIDVERHTGVNSRILFYGLARAFVESTESTGAIAVVAASILGEKRQLTSNMVSIDVKQIDLRGTVPAPKMTIHYTTDGSNPGKTSPTYTERFAVKLGTTVKALVLADDAPILKMEVRFAKDVPFSWSNDASGDSGGESSTGEQAEDATFSGAEVASSMKGFHGRGHLVFSNKGGKVEWYLENDGGAGPRTFSIRYSGAGEKAEPVAMELSINGDLHQLKSMGGKGWQTLARKGVLKQGANRVVLKPMGAVLIDELSVEQE